MALPMIPYVTSVETTDAMTRGPKMFIAKLPAITSITKREAPMGAL
jgi:hypothetical protein